MALVAVFALLALVDIIQLMAAKTIHFQLDLVDILLVTTRTFHLGMLTL